MTIKTIGQGLATRLKTIADLQVFAPDELPDTPNSFPSAMILPGNITYHLTHDEAYDIEYRLLLLFTKQDQPSAISAMVDYMEVTGTKSVKAAIEGERTLGGAAGDVQVNLNSGVGNITWGGIVYISTEFKITVYGGTL